MTMFHIWLLWTIDFALFSIIMIVRLVPVLSLRQRAWYAPQIFYVIFSLAGTSAGIFKLATEPSPTLAAPVDVYYVVLAGALLVFLGIAFIRELSRFTAYRAGRAAAAHVAARRYTDAEGIYDQLVKRYPKKAVSWVNKGAVLLWQDRLDEALAASDQALALNPKYIPAWILKIASLAEKHRYADGLAICEHTLELSPKDASAWSWKAQLLERSGHLEEALATCDQLLQFGGTGNTDAIRGAAWGTKAVALNALGRYAEVLAAAEEAVRLNPRPVRSRLAQVTALTHLQRPEEAHAAAEQGLIVADQMLAERSKNIDAWQVKRDLLRFFGREAEAYTADEHLQALLSELESESTRYNPSA